MKTLAALTAAGILAAGTQAEGKPTLGHNAAGRSFGVMAVKLMDDTSVSMSHGGPTDVAINVCWSTTGKHAAHRSRARMCARDTDSD